MNNTLAANELPALANDFRIEIGEFATPRNDDDMLRYIVYAPTGYTEPLRIGGVGEYRIARIVFDKSGTGDTRQLEDSVAPHIALFLEKSGAVEWKAVNRDGRDGWIELYYNDVEDVPLALIRANAEGGDTKYPYGLVRK